MRGLWVLLILLTPLCASAGRPWICHRADGTRVFQDRPCDEPAPPLEGVVEEPAPRANDPNPGWCAAHQAWRDQAQGKSASAASPAETAKWQATRQEHQRWLKAHHCK